PSLVGGGVPVPIPALTPALAGSFAVFPDSPGSIGDSADSLALDANSGAGTPPNCVFAPVSCKLTADEATTLAGTEIGCSATPCKLLVPVRTEPFESEFAMRDESSPGPAVVFWINDSAAASSRTPSDCPRKAVPPR